MGEPESPTLHMLREFREKFGEFRREFSEFRLTPDDRFTELARLFAGESILGRYAAADVDKRLETREQRVRALEEHR
jgi:hypothetical protein